ncbi:DUF6681 family protein [Agrilactobacillus yilanensis]|uniref:DUF6681 family protein n=1 Tax=Agrilactobacillus yilanensis TaxID=2485997 RepID=A0ABW4J852_9LACO|nr:DUF6681 family protein [Agrilactobacillus yilanensis]
MLSILDTLNHFLGYFSINSKPRSRIYTVIASIGNFYLLYLAIHAFRYQYFLRGAIYLGVFLILLYFCVLNAIYYFTDKTVKFDISPKIEKLLGGPPKDALEKANATEAAPKTKIRNIPTAGLFNENSLVPATVDISADEQANLNLIVDELVRQSLVTAGFDQLDEGSIKQRLLKNDNVQRLEAPLDLPFFDLQVNGDHVVILAGLNALTAKPVGHLAHVGLTSIEQAVQDYNLALAKLQVNGGPQKVLNADQITEVPTPYELQAKVAFQPKKDEIEQHES